MRGHGTAEAREALRVDLKDLSEVEEKGQRAQLSLSSNNRFVKAEGEARTHNIQFVHPELLKSQLPELVGPELSI
jgi:hypothetical protein